jgi:hypothetical protein
MTQTEDQIRQLQDCGVRADGFNLTKGRGGAARNKNVLLELSRGATFMHIRRELR